jgi:hypothetical protein
VVTTLFFADRFIRARDGDSDHKLNHILEGDTAVRNALEGKVPAVSRGAYSEEHIRCSVHQFIRTEYGKPTPGP